MSSLTKSKKRVKEQGEVYTPPQLTNILLDEVEDRLKDCSKTILDPTCGNGNILIEVYKRRLSLGCDATEALATIYGIDIMPDNVQECKDRLKELALGAEVDNDLIEKILDQNIKCANTLEVDIETLFIQ
jgi:methylase of polypeptide subunit release factors